MLVAPAEFLSLLGRALGEGAAGFVVAPIVAPHHSGVAARHRSRQHQLQLGKWNAGGVKQMRPEVHPLFTCVEDGQLVTILEPPIQRRSIDVHQQMCELVRASRMPLTLLKIFHVLSLGLKYSRESSRSSARP